MAGQRITGQWVDEVIAWEDPPPVEKVPSKAEKVVAELKTHPGQWALVDQGDNMPIMGNWSSELAAWADVEVRLIRTDRRFMGGYKKYARWCG